MEEIYTQIIQHKKLNWKVWKRNDFIFMIHFIVKHHLYKTDERWKTILCTVKQKYYQYYK